MQWAEKLTVTPNETIEQIVHDLTDVCIKVKLKEDDSKIDTLNSMLLKGYQERKSSEEELTATIDKANSEISTLTSKVSELEIVTVKYSSLSLTF